MGLLNDIFTTTQKKYKNNIGKQDPEFLVSENSVLPDMPYIYLQKVLILPDYCYTNLR